MEDSEEIIKRLEVLFARDELYKDLFIQIVERGTDTKMPSYKQAISTFEKLESTLRTKLAKRYLIKVADLKL